MVRPSGIEPPHTAPEAVALSTELRACLPNKCYYSRVSQKMQGLFYFFSGSVKFTWNPFTVKDRRIPWITGSGALKVPSPGQTLPRL